MKAIVYTQYGSPDRLQLSEAAKPEPGADEVLVKVQSVSLNFYDWHMLSADVFLVRSAAGWSKPNKTILGQDIAGLVEAVGANVSGFQPGDAVFGDISSARNGGLGEYAAVPARLLVPKPANLSFAEAAAVPMAALTALQALRDSGHLRPGQQVLINGASGGVGTFALQLAKLLGAEVTAVCSTRNLDQARALGADHVIDYTREDFSRGGQRYDLILAANGKRSILSYRRALKPGGILVGVGGALSQIFQVILLGPLFSRLGKHSMRVLTARASQDDLLYLKGLLEAGKIKAVIDRQFPLERAADAMRYLGAGHARGKIVIQVAEA